MVAITEVMDLDEETYQKENGRFVCMVKRGLRRALDLCKGQKNKLSERVKQKQLKDWQTTLVT